MDLIADPAGLLLRLGAWDVRLRGPRAVTTTMGAVLGELAIPEELPPLEIVISKAGEARAQIGGDAAWTLPLPKRGWLPLLLAQTVGTATSLLRDLLFIHAAAVAIQGRGYVLVGAPRAGKTAAAAILVRDGATYLSDEVALLDARSGTVHPFLLPLAVKPQTAEAIGPLPAVRDVAQQAGVRYAMPRRCAAAPVELDSVILLDPDHPAREVTDLPRADLLLTLSQHASSFRYRDRLVDAFSGFVRLLRAARCLRIASAVPAEAAAGIAALHPP